VYALRNDETILTAQNIPLKGRPMHVSCYKFSQISLKRRLWTVTWLLLALPLVTLHAVTLEDATRAVEAQQYPVAIRLLGGNRARTAPEFFLLGKAHFQMGNFDEAAEALERAVAAAPGNATMRNWLGRAQGMRAERANPFRAMGLARQARDHFEAAVKSDPKNLEAVSDLFSFYLAAPGFLGGGVEKAQALAETVKAVNAGEYAFLQAQLAEKTKDYAAAEKHYREAQAREPQRVGRWIDLAKFYTRRGMSAQAEEALGKAKALAPGAPRLLFDEANLLVRAGRGKAQARELLRKYQASARRDSDPPPYEVQQLFEKLEKLEK
jgi:tetratricopeptide (TPR) repeat protein